MSHRRVNVGDANVKTVNVKIKAVSLNNKQMTLAVFRQIPEEDILNRCVAQLNGTPWGLVNYSWKEQNYDSNHIQVLWQKGNELRRCLIEKVSYCEEICQQILASGVYRVQRYSTFEDNYWFLAFYDGFTEKDDKDDDKAIIKAAQRAHSNFRKCRKLLTQLEQLEQLYIAV